MRSFYIKLFSCLVCFSETTVSAVRAFGTGQKEDPQGGETWIHLFGSVPEARPAQSYRLIINRPATQKLTIKGAKRYNNFPFPLSIFNYLRTGCRTAKVSARTTGRAEARDYANRLRRRYAAGFLLYLLVTGKTECQCIADLR